MQSHRVKDLEKEGVLTAPSAPLKQEDWREQVKEQITSWVIGASSQGRQTPAEGP